MVGWDGFFVLCLIRQSSLLRAHWVECSERTLRGWRDAQRQEQPGEECRLKSGRRGRFGFYSCAGGESSELSRVELKGLNAAGWNVFS